MKRLSRQELERTGEVLDEHDGNMALAAKALGITVFGLRGRLTKLIAMADTDDTVATPKPRKRGRWRPSKPAPQVTLQPVEIPQPVPVAAPAAVVPVPEPPAPEPVVPEAPCDLYHRELWAAYKADPTISRRNDLVTLYLGIVDREAGRLHSTLPHSVQIDDLKQAGAIGLLQAIEKFEPERGNRFETFAPMRVRGAMQDSIRISDHVPRLCRQRNKTLSRTLAEMTQVNGHTPTLDAVCDKLQWTPAQVRDATPMTQISITPRRDSDDDPFGLTEDTITDPYEHEAGIREALQGLNMDETVLMYLYYWKDQTMREIGRSLMLSESRISQMHSAIVAGLRSRGKDRLLQALITNKAG